MTNIALAVGVIVGTVLLLLNIRELLYLRDKQREQAAQRGHTSWLLGILMRSTVTTAAVSAVFLGVFVVRIVIGVQPWTAWASVMAILWLLLIPVLRGFEIRRHEL